MSTSSSSGSLYEIVIGGWGNQISCLRKCKQCTCKKLYRGRVLGGMNVYRTFWLGWAGGRIRLGKGSTYGSGVLMDFPDSSPYSVKYMGISTGWGSTGYWQIDVGKSAEWHFPIRWNSLRYICNTQYCSGKYGVFKKNITVQNFMNIEKVLGAQTLENTKRKLKRSDSVLWQKTLNPKKNPKYNVTTQNFDYKTIVDRLMDQTCVVKLVYGILNFPLTPKAVQLKMCKCSSW